MFQPRHLAVLTCAAMLSTGFQATPPAKRPKPAPPTIQGTIEGSDGQPVADAVVVARALTAAFGSSPRTARSDAKGAFRLYVQSAVLHSLRIEATGLAPRTLDRVVPGAPLMVVLQKGESIEGVVLQGATGQRVGGAQVRALQERASDLAPPGDAGSARIEALTSADGRFRIEGLTPGRHRFFATVRGYGCGATSALVPGQGLRISLSEGGWITGIVRGPNNRPVAGAVVRAEPETVPAFGAPPATSDGSGRFDIAGLGDGVYGLVVRHPDFAPGLTRNVTVEKGVEARVYVSLSQGSTIAGRLIESSGQSVRGRVSLQELDGEAGSRALADLVHAEAGPDGRFRIERVPLGSHIFVATASGQVPRQVQVEVDSQRRDVDLGDVTLEASLTIRGHARDKEGRPVPSARVEAVAEPSAAPPSSWNPPEAYTETDGSFVVSVPGPGTYRIGAMASGFVGAGAVKKVEAGAENVLLVLEPAGAISGLVVDDHDRPFDGFRVLVRPTQHDLDPLRSLWGEAQGEGRFLVSDAAPGTYLLEVSAPERVKAAISDVRVTPGLTTDVGRVRLPAGGIVRGLVADSSGSPVDGATVTAHSSGGNGIAFGSQSQTSTDGSGLFELHGLAAGLVDLAATHADFSPGRVAGLDVDPDRGPTETRITLSEGGRIEGWVRSRDGAGVAGMQVWISAASPGSTLSGSSAVTTRPDGSFVVEHVPAGRVRMTFMAKMGPTSPMGVHAKDVDVREGETTQVELSVREILISGRVMRRGQPASGFKVTLRGRASVYLSVSSAPAQAAPADSGPETTLGITRADGSYDLIVQEPGRYSAVVESADGRMSYPPRAVEVPDADSFPLDFEFGGVTLSGIVVDAQSEAPVAQAEIHAVASKAAGAHSPTARTGADGRFSIDLDPGDYRLNARAEGYRAGGIDVTVGNGAAEVRIPIVRGLTISGRVVDRRGRGIGGLNVSARGKDGLRTLFGSAETMSDGSFQLTGLSRNPYNLFVGSEALGFALQTDVMPGSAPVTLTLRPGGRVRLHVLGPDGLPVEGAQASPTRVNGIEVMSIGSGRSASGAQGFADLTLPAGAVELRVVKERLSARTILNVGEGGSVSAQVMLSEPPQRRSQ